MKLYHTYPGLETVSCDPILCARTGNASFGVYAVTKEEKQVFAESSCLK